MTHNWYFFPLYDPQKRWAIVLNVVVKISKTNKNEASCKLFHQNKWEKQEVEKKTEASMMKTESIND